MDRKELPTEPLARFKVINEITMKIVNQISKEYKITAHDLREIMEHAKYHGPFWLKF